MGLLELNGMERNPLLACEFCTAALMVLNVLHRFYKYYLYLKTILSFNNIKILSLKNTFLDTHQKIHF